MRFLARANVAAAFLRLSSPPFQCTLSNIVVLQDILTLISFARDLSNDRGRKFMLLPKGVGELLSYVQCASPSISRMPVSSVILQARPVE